jgi:hypothetical protein
MADVQKQEAEAQVQASKESTEKIVAAIKESGAKTAEAVKKAVGPNVTHAGAGSKVGYEGADPFTETVNGGKMEAR